MRLSISLIMLCLGFSMVADLYIGSCSGVAFWEGQLVSDFLRAMCMHKSLSRIGSLDPNEPSRGAVGKSSSLSSSESTAGGGKASKFRCLHTIQ